MTLNKEGFFYTLMAEGREHMYTHVHLYSVADLLGVRDGRLLLAAQEADAFARRHISKCGHCKVSVFFLWFLSR